MKRHGSRAGDITCRASESVARSLGVEANRAIPGNLAASLVLALVVVAMTALPGCTAYTSASAAKSQTATQTAGTDTQTAGSGVLSAGSTSLGFGSVTVGSAVTQSLSLTNTGTATVDVSQAQISGAGLSIVGSATGSIAAGQSSKIQIQFLPQAAGAVSGSLTLTSDASNASVTVALSGTGTEAAISVTPSSLNFGSVVVGSSASQPITLKNTGTANLTISQDSVTGAGFSVTGLSAETIAPGNSITFNAVFTPSGAGSDSGNISLTTDASSSATSIALSGTGTQAAISLSPSSVSFGSVVDGSTNSQPITLKNTGTANLTISQDSVTGAGFNVSGLSAQTIAPGNSVMFNAVFSPTAAGSASGSVSVTSNASGSATTVTLSGTGVAPTYVLTANPSSLTFASTNVGSSSSLGVTLTNGGNSQITISNVNSTNAVFATSGAGAGTILTPGQSTTLNVVFTPTASGSASATVTVASNATATPTISASGTGAQVSHSVDLSWGASASADVVGYNVYKGTISGGPYTKLTSSGLVSVLQYDDSAVQAGQTYYYVVTAVDSSNDESAYSNQVSATIQ